MEKGILNLSNGYCCISCFTAADRAERDTYAICSFPVGPIGMLFKCWTHRSTATGSPICTIAVPSLVFKNLIRATLPAILKRTWNLIRKEQPQLSRHVMMCVGKAGWNHKICLKLPHHLIASILYRVYFLHFPTVISDSPNSLFFFTTYRINRRD